MAEVRSPDVLHPQDGPCDCLTHGIQVKYSWVREGWENNNLVFQAGYSNSTEELNNEMKNLESVMKDLNAIAAPPSQPQYNGSAHTQTQC